jgi:hypothetical protein
MTFDPAAELDGGRMAAVVCRAAEAGAETEGEMRISELIAKLEAIRAEHGDLPVAHQDEWGDIHVDEVEFRRGKTESYPGFGTQRVSPDHVMLSGVEEINPEESPPAR